MKKQMNDEKVLQLVKGKDRDGLRQYARSCGLSIEQTIRAIVTETLKSWRDAQSDPALAGARVIYP